MSRSITYPLFSSEVVHNLSQMEIPSASHFQLALLCSPPSYFTERKLDFVDAIVNEKDAKESMKEEVEKLLKIMDGTLAAYSGAYLYLDITDDVMNGTKERRNALSSYFGVERRNENVEDDSNSST